MNDDERSAESRTATPHGAGQAPPPGETLQRLVAGDAQALGQLLRRHKDRLRRIVAVRLAVRLARVLETEDLPEETISAALAGLRDVEVRSEAEVVRWMARLIEREVRRRPEANLGATRAAGRTLRLEGTESAGHSSEREDRERLLDARVAELEPAELREVLLLRDYCGADWELVRAKLGLVSLEAAQELYRRAHAHLASRVRSAARRSG